MKYLWLILIFHTSAFAAEIPYKFKILDIKIPGQQWPRADLVDINREGKILALTSMLNGEAVSIISDGKVHKKFGCPKLPGETLSFTGATAISDKSHIVGTCWLWNPATGSYRTVPFWRARTGEIVDLSTVNGGYTYSYPQGISPGGAWITGNYYDGINAQSRCFLLSHRVNVWTFTDIVLPSPLPTADVEHNCISVNKFGQVLGSYLVSDIATNAGVTSGYFIWDKGVFSFPLTLSFSADGGPYNTVYDMDGDNDALLSIYNGNDGSGYAIFYFDDGVSYGIAEPPSWSVNDIGGMSTKSSFVGNVTIVKGVDQSCYAEYQNADYCTIEESHGFVATPAN